MDSVAEPVGGTKKVKSLKKNAVKESSKSTTEKKAKVKKNDEAVDKEEDDSKVLKTPSKSPVKGKSPSKATSGTEKPKKKVIKKKASVVAEANADEEVEGGTNAGAQEIVRQASQVVHPGVNEVVAPATPVLRKVVKKKGKKSVMLTHRWQKAITQTIKSWLYAKIQDVHRGRWDQEEDLREVQVARKRGIPGKNRRVWERDETAELVRKSKRQKYECRLWRRVGDRHYQQDEYADAQEAYRQALTFGHISGQQWVNVARCSMELFKVDPTNGQNLETALIAYQHTLDFVGQSPALARRLPTILLEVARVYESYGAFEGALTQLGMIVENSAFTDDLQDDTYERALLRSVLIMKHLSTLPGAPSADLLQRCQQFLERIIMEDPLSAGSSSPHSNDSSLQRECRRREVRRGLLANGELLTYLYARICEMQCSSIGSIKAVEGYQRLFRLRKERYRQTESIQDKKANNAGKHASWEAWFTDTKTWDELGQEFAAEGEMMLFIEAAQRREHIQPYQEIAPLLSLVRAHLAFQDIDLGVYYGTRAWEFDHYNHAVRDLLRRISPDFKQIFEMEERAVNKIQRRWRLRPWRDSFIEKYQASLVEEWEAELKQRPYYRPVRDKLAYFAREKWRRVFLYQEVAATRIALWFRGRITHHKFFRALRDKHVRELATLYTRWRKRPFNAAIRAEVRSMAAHRYTPKNHRVFQLLSTLNREDTAATCIQALVRMRAAKLKFAQNLQGHKQRAIRKRKKALHRIMNSFRSLGAMRRYQRLRKEMQAGTTIALALQKRMRGYWARTQFREWLEERAWEAAEAARRDKAARVLQKMWRGCASRRMMAKWRKCIKDIQKGVRGLQGRRRVQKLRSAFAFRIQQRWRQKVAKDQFRSMMQTVRDQHKTQSVGSPSGVSDRFGQTLASSAKSIGVSQIFRAKVDSAIAAGGDWYRPMGVFASSAVFRRALLLPALVYAPAFAPLHPMNPEYDDRLENLPPIATSFGAGDAHMLANFLAYGQGKGNQVRTLVFCGADLSHEASTEGLARSLSKAKDLRSLAIGDSRLSRKALGNLCRLLLVNYSLNELVLDSLPGCFNEANERAVGALAGDFFMQRFGHLQRLSLCRNDLSEVTGHLMAGALRSPTSTLLHLCLAGNKISDAAGVAIGEALGHNACLTELDLSSNRLETPAGRALAKCLLTNRSLRTLLLPRNLIRDDVTSPFLSSLRVNAVLVDLDVAGNLFRREKEAKLIQVMAARRKAAQVEAHSMGPPDPASVSATLRDTGSQRLTATMTSSLPFRPHTSAGPATPGLDTSAQIPIRTIRTVRLGDTLPMDNGPEWNTLRPSTSGSAAQRLERPVAVGTGSLTKSLHMSQSVTFTFNGTRSMTLDDPAVSIMRPLRPITNPVPPGSRFRPVGFYGPRHGYKMRRVLRREVRERSRLTRSYEHRMEGEEVQPALQAFDVRELGPIVSDRAAHASRSVLPPHAVVQAAVDTGEDGMEMDDAAQEEAMVVSS